MYKIAYQLATFTCALIGSSARIAPNAPPEIRTLSAIASTLFETRRKMRQAKPIDSIDQKVNQAYSLHNGSGFPLGYAVSALIKPQEDIFSYNFCEQSWKFNGSFATYQAAEPTNIYQFPEYRKAA
jgi:hypothetical protein